MVTRDDDEEKRRLLSLPSGPSGTSGVGAASGAGGTSEAGKRAAAGAVGVASEAGVGGAGGTSEAGVGGAGGLAAAGAVGAGSVGWEDAEAKRHLLADRSLADTAIAVSIGVVLFTLVAALVLFGVFSPPSASIGGTTPPAATAVATTAATAVATTAATTVATTAPTAVAPPAEGPLTVPFTTSGVTTTKSYTGTTTITISGVGQTASTHMSDAFYTYTDLNGQPITPFHELTRHSLCINGKPVDTFVQSIPAYSADHKYTFQIQAPGGPLSFGVCDSVLTDNTGSFTITVS